jgi:hypothetical protein
MTAKDMFTAEEWARVSRAPATAGFAVSAADPGGLVGLFQEASAMAGALKDAKAGSAEGSLVGEIAAAMQTGEGRGAASDGLKAVSEGRRPAEACEAAVAELRETASIVAAKAPGEQAAFAAFIRDVAARVAEAAKEGGFLGFGGEPVSEAERKTLADIDAAVAPPAAPPAA